MFFSKISRKVVLLLLWMNAETVIGGLFILAHCHGNMVGKDLDVNCRAAFSLILEELDNSSPAKEIDNSSPAKEDVPEGKGDEELVFCVIHSGITLFKAEPEQGNGEFFLDNMSFG